MSTSVVCSVHDDSEIWKNVPGYKGYQVSNRGSVRSLDRIVECFNTKTQTKYKKRLKGQLLKLVPNNYGYLTVTLNDGRIVGVHRLVLLTFVGPCPPGQQCRHFPDGNKSHNCVENLLWGTVRENNEDKITQGTMSRGESHGAAVLNEKQVREIRVILNQPLPPTRKRRKRGFITGMCKKYGVTRKTLYLAARGVSWKSLQ